MNKIPSLSHWKDYLHLLEGEEKQFFSLLPYQIMKVFSNMNIILESHLFSIEKIDSTIYLFYESENRKIHTLYLTHKERLLRFGSELIFKLCTTFGQMLS